MSGWDMFGAGGGGGGGEDGLLHNDHEGLGERKRKSWGLPGMMKCSRNKFQRQHSHYG